MCIRDREDIEVTRVRGTTGDLAAIGDLRTRFEEDLATWYADQQGLRDSVKRVEENALVAEERVSRVVAAQVAMEEQVEAIRRELAAYHSALQSLEDLLDQRMAQPVSYTHLDVYKRQAWKLPLFSAKRTTVSSPVWNTERSAG